MLEVCWKYGISEQLFYRWKKKFGQMTPSEFKKMKQLEDENRRPTGLKADLTLDKQMLQEVLKKKTEGWTPADRSEAAPDDLFDERAPSCAGHRVVAKHAPEPESTGGPDADSHGAPRPRHEPSPLRLSTFDGSASVPGAGPTGAGCG